MHVNATRRTPNTQPRTRPIALLVMHATASGRDSALNWLAAARSGVSCHAVIDKPGIVWELAHDNLATWHAGESQWDGLETWSNVKQKDGSTRRVPSVNMASLGCELVNFNNGRDPYPETQYQAALEWAASKVARYGITPRNVTRHLDVARPIGRKDDPRGFPWERFMAELFAHRPAPAPEPVAGRRRFYVPAETWVRGEPNDDAPRPIALLQRGEYVHGVVVPGERITRNGITSDEWVRLDRGGYVWKPPLREATP